jgi:hypothetical protein
LAHLNPVTPVTHALVPTASKTDVTGSVVPGSVFLGLSPCPRRGQRTDSGRSGTPRSDGVTLVLV